MTIAFLVVYLVIQLAICFYISKRIQNESDYLVAGRSFPAYIVSISLFATWFGAETCIGSSAMVFSEGISGSRADPFGYSLCLFLSGALIASKIYNGNYITLSDFFRDRFGSLVEKLSVWILSLGALIWAAAQFRAFAQVVSATTNLDLEITLVIGLVFVIFYTSLAGMMGDMITDVIQAFVIVFGIAVLFFTVLGSDIDIGAILRNMESSRFSLLGESESVLARLDRWAIPIFGSLITQEVIGRLLSSKSKVVAVKSCYIGGAIYVVVGLLPVFLGLIGPGLIEIDGDPEQFLILLAKKYLSPAMVGLLAAALISALLATIDSILISVGGLIGHNFVIPLMKIEDPNKKLRVNRIIVVIGSLIASALAAFGGGIYDLLEAASSFGTAGILVITLIGLWSKFGGKRASLAALIMGLITNPIADNSGSESPFLLSILFALLAYVVAAIALKETSESQAMG